MNRADSIKERISELKEKIRYTDEIYDTDLEKMWENFEANIKYKLDYHKKSMARLNKELDKANEEKEKWDAQIEIAKKISNEMLENVKLSYAGKVGCMCGCNGTYRVPQRFAEEYQESRKYEVDKETISNSTVTRRYNMVMDAVKSGDVDEYIYHEDFYGYENNERTVILYKKI